MRKTEHMDRYNDITSTYISGTYDSKRDILILAIKFLSSLKPSCHMYGDEFGWITAGELLESCKLRLGFVEMCLINEQNMHEDELYEQHLKSEYEKRSDLDHEFHQFMRRECFGY